ncbi:DUF1836 domain-containing protein [Virgibacillus sp. NKC19-3]|uniref:DUF1836 domain-containing protein n=1 Tax=Virgibacillus saliphilus TaxID=2831674 RepID=UPI001C9ACDDC|nr:DUF1836 domain-containing protein [Virgibacillus sp. NKC19-3]MBY7144035.1 DUF1836 domain-containing protein [Virgibacillus sp. NKC19-3]
MKNMDDLLEALDLDNHLSFEEIPDIDLYMDQVIQLFENKFADSKRNDDEKVLTKTMINNYAKGKLFFPVQNKKYSKDHLILISMIYQMKGALSINDVKTTLDKLNTKLTEDDFDLQHLYKHYVKLSETNVDMFKEDLQTHKQEVNKEIVELEDTDAEYLQQLLMVATLTSMSNFYRRAAEKIVDEIGKKGEE